MEPPKKLSEWASLLGNQDDFENFMRNYELRSEHIEKCGFPIVTEELVNVMSAWIADRPVIDVGCGIGYLAYHLLTNNVNITAVDNFSTTYRHGSFFRSSNFIIQGDALSRHHYVLAGL